MAVPRHRCPRTAREWQIIAKDPAAHEGERIIVYGRVTQFDAATRDDTFRTTVDGIDHPGETYAFDTNTVLSGDAGTLRDIVDDDLFRADVTVAGSMSYDTQIGGSTTAPRLTVRAGPGHPRQRPGAIRPGRGPREQRHAALTAATPGCPCASVNAPEPRAPRRRPCGHGSRPPRRS
jgi:hypothetical protein